MPNFLLWLVTFVHALCCLGGAAFLVLLLTGWLYLCKDEYRCHRCAERHECPAACTGVAYPCTYYAKEKKTARG